MNERTRSHPLGLGDIEARLTLSIDEVASVLGLGRTAAYEAARRIRNRWVNRSVIPRQQNSLQVTPIEIGSRKG